MSVTGILAELPKLDSSELEPIVQRTRELQGGRMLEPSPELARAIEEARAFPDEQSVSLSEAYRRVETQPTRPYWARSAEFRCGPLRG